MESPTKPMLKALLSLQGHSWRYDVFHGKVLGWGLPS